MGTEHTPSRTPRAKIVPVRYTEPAVDLVDKHRGTWTRSEYIRRATERAIREGLKGPAPLPEPEVIKW